MASASADGHRPDEGNGQPPEIILEDLPDQVAELAAELSEAESGPLRKRLARQVPQLASRSGQATRRGLGSGRDVAWRGLQSGRDVAWRGLISGRDAAWQGWQSGRDAAFRRAGPSRDVAVRGARSGRDATARVIQFGRGAAARGTQSGGDVARQGGRAARRSSDVAWRGVRVGGTATWQGLRVGGQWLAGQAMEMAPKVPIRGIGTLRDQYPGLGTDELADHLIKSAARASAGVGAAMGMAAATPFIPTMPVELAVETLALVGIELKLVAELHEVYGMPAPGSRTERMLAYLGAWANRRGVRITGEGVALVVGSPLRRKLERRLVAKAGQSTLSLAPLLAGAAAGAMIDHRETRKLGQQVRDDLRGRAAGTTPAELAGRARHRRRPR
jgi:hypothetical protein